MKFMTVLLLVLAAFSPALSEKVDPFASSSTVAKDDISPITNSDASGTTTPNTEQHQDIKEAIANGRELNDADCRKFVNYIAVDDKTTTLRQWCDKPEHNCCQRLAACASWSTTATYEVCKNSCNNREACYRVAAKATSAATIKFESGSCNSSYSCNSMALTATNLQTLTVGKNSCSGSSSCSLAAKNAKYLKQLFIADEQCKSSCKSCGAGSIFDDTLQLTETCCAAEAGTKDTACNYFDLTSNQPSNLPSSIPSTSSIPSNIPSDSPSDQPSSEPTWLDDEQCKKKNPKNDTCTKLGGRCKIDCEDDENYVCVPGLCAYNKKWNKPNKKSKLRELINEEEEIVEMEISAIGNTERNLKTPKAPKLKTPKASKAPKSSCACRVPKNK